ncbi:hypothetical protein ACHAWX_002541 [Stephanocyclus meneghinianus]
MSKTNITPLVQSFQPLRTYIRQHLTHLRSTPCLMITSSSPATPNNTTSGKNSAKEITPYDSKVNSFVQRNTQSIVSEFNIRAVPVTSTSAFPTLENVNEAISLAKRAGLKPSSGGGRGEGVILGIGSGPAMDLAKAVSDRIHGCGSTHGNLILAPATLGGLWAASSKFSSSLLLDTKEEMLLPHRMTSSSSREKESGDICQRDTVIALDSIEKMSIPPLYSAMTSTRRSNAPADLSMAHVAAAALAIVLDLARVVDTQQPGLDIDYFTRQIKSVASSCSAIIEAASTKSNDFETNCDAADDSNFKRNDYAQGEMLIEAILTLSSVMDQLMIAQSSNSSRGTAIPQHLAKALLPTYFPQSHIFTFMACTLPGLCDALDSHKTETTLLGEVAQTILNSASIDDDARKRESPLSALSTWATNITHRAGIPSMASLAFGTPELNALLEKLDAYNALTESECNVVGVSRSHDRLILLEEVLERSLNR